MNDEFEKLILSVLNRPIYQVLTAEIIDNASDLELPQIVVDSLIEKIDDNYEKQYETIGELEHENDSFQYCKMINVGKTIIQHIVATGIGGDNPHKNSDKGNKNGNGNITD